MENAHIQMVSSNWWKGYQIMIIDRVASEIPATFLDEIMALCRHMYMSVELCAFSSEDGQRLSLAIILRYEGNNAYAIEGFLNEKYKLLESRFSTNNFSVHAAKDDDPVKTHIEQFFQGRVTSDMIGCSFFPKDQLLGYAPYYMPGAYTPGTLSPLNWKTLAEILLRHPHSIMCLLLQSTFYSELETSAIEYGERTLSALPAEYKASLPLKTYRQLKSQSAVPLACINIAFIGSHLFAQDITAQMRNWKYNTFNFVVQGAFATKSYLYFGNAFLQQNTFRLGHMEACAKWFAKEFSAANPNPFTRLSHIATQENISKLIALPHNTLNIPGLTVNKHFISQALIDKKIQYTDEKKNSMLFIGNQTGSNRPIGIELDELCKHGIIVGKSGCGKTTVAMGLLKQLHEKGIKFLVIEPAKREYRSLLGEIPDLKIYTPGVSDAAPLQMNPFIPPSGITREQYQSTLMNIMNVAISMDHPLDVILPEGIDMCYTRYGWRKSSTRDSLGAEKFGLREFVKCYQDFIAQRYASSPESKGNLESGGLTRLLQPINDNSLLFDTIQSFDVNELLNHSTVIELDAIKNASQKSLVMLTIMYQLALCLEQRSAMDSSLKNIIMIDEAHVLLGQDNSVAMDGRVDVREEGIHFLQDSLKTYRAYGVGILFGDQSPQKLTREILGHVHTKLMFNMDDPHDISLVSSITQMDAAMQQDIKNLTPGQGYLSITSSLPTPARIQTKNYKKELSLKTNIANHEISTLTNAVFAAPFKQCSLCKSCNGICKSSMRQDAEFLVKGFLYAEKTLAILERKNQQHTLPKYLQQSFEPFISSLIEKQGLEKNYDLVPLKDCAKAQLIRQLSLDGRCTQKEEVLIQALFSPVNSASAMKEETSAPSSAVSEEASLPSSEEIQRNSFNKIKNYIGNNKNT